MHMSWLYENMHIVMFIILNMNKSFSKHAINNSLHICANAITEKRAKGHHLLVISNH